jgi:tetratricopeptide (TPR) repeat protein
MTGRVGDTDPATERAGLPHTVFLRRLAGASQPSALEPRLGRAAFVALRLVDMLGPEHATLHPDAFHYQYVATTRCCRDLPPGSTEASHLLGLVRSTADAFPDRRTELVLPALFAYAHLLEDEMRLEEALDVLDTMLQIGAAKLLPADAVGARLRRARVYRKLNEFDAAEQSYAEGGALAAAIGDTHSELLSRIGRVQAVRGRGNLAEAERSLLGVLDDAETLRDHEAQARAHQEMAVILSTGGRPADAIPHEWRAFELYQDGLSRKRVLGDLGIMLLFVGDAAAAERALMEVVRDGATEDVLDNAMVELMHCASFRRDRVGFERWREQCDARRESMPPNILVDYILKAGIGRARFGQLDRAERLLVSALRIAEEAGLHEFTFRIERIKAGLRDSCQPLNEVAAEAAEPVVQSEAVREVSAALAHLASAT